MFKCFNSQGVESPKNVEVPYMNDWQPPTYPYIPLKYYVDRDRVYVSGAVRGGLNGGMIFTLPKGLVPNMPIESPISTSLKNGSQAFIKVDMQGNVSIWVTDENTNTNFIIESFSFWVG